MCAPARGLERARVVDAVGSLVAKSILTMGRGTRRGRYRLLETLRVYGAERLAEAGEEATLAAAHAAWYARRFSGGFECYVPAGAKMPAPHSHNGFEETIYGLEGVTTWTIGGKIVDISAGEAVRVRRGQIHAFENHGSVDATFLAIATPGLFGPGYFHEIRDVLAATGGPPDLTAIGDVMRRHGLAPAPVSAV
jgi:mannose-6-phosphate isomerase-like protein (cupin superfamily)